jgi:hypothetical protein
MTCREEWDKNYFTFCLVGVLPRRLVGVLSRLLVGVLPPQLETRFSTECPAVRAHGGKKKKKKKLF